MIQVISDDLALIAPTPYDAGGVLKSDFNLESFLLDFEYSSNQSMSVSITYGIENSLLPNAIKYREQSGEAAFRAWVKSEYINPGISAFNFDSDSVRTLVDGALTIIANVIFASHDVFTYFSRVFDDWEITHPTQEEIAEMNDYAQMWAAFYTSLSVDIDGLRRLHVKRVNELKSLVGALEKAYQVIQESYESQIIEMQATIDRLTALLHQLLEENDRLRKENLSLKQELDKRKSLFGGMSNPFEGFDFDKIVKYALWGLGIFAGIKVIGLFK